VRAQTYNLQHTHEQKTKPRYRAMFRNCIWVVFDRIDVSHMPAHGPNHACQMARELNEQAMARGRRAGVH